MWQGALIYLKESCGINREMAVQWPPHCLTSIPRARHILSGFLLLGGQVTEALGSSRFAFAAMAASLVPVAALSTRSAARISVAGVRAATGTHGKDEPMNEGQHGGTRRGMRREAPSKGRLNF